LLFFFFLQKGSTKPLELAYTALARMAATAGDGDAALEATSRGLKAGVTPKLRGFVPALLAYAVAGDSKKAFQVSRVVHASCCRKSLAVTMATV